MKTKIFGLGLLACALLFQASRAAGADAYVVHIRASSGERSDGSRQFWSDDLLLHNSGEAAGSVRVVAASNGVTLPISDPLPVAAGKTIVFDLEGIASQGPTPSMFVLHLDIEGQLVVASRLLSGSVISGSPSAPPNHGGVPLPVVRQLVPAGQEQILLDADLLGLDSRLNVSLYNAGAVEANALVELVGECDDNVAATFHEIIAPNAIQQFNGLGPQPLCDLRDTLDRPTYVRITMDQPGFSFATMLANTGDLTVPVGVATVGTP